MVCFDQLIKEIKKDGDLGTGTKAVRKNEDENNEISEVEFHFLKFLIITLKLQRFDCHVSFSLPHQF